MRSSWRARDTSANERVDRCASVLRALARQLGEPNDAPVTSGARATEGMHAAAFVLQPQPTATRVLAFAALRTLELELHGIDVDAQLGPLPAALATDAVEALEAALVHLVDNVIDHAKARHVVINLVTGNGTIGLLVADDGRGFDIDDIEHPDIFNPAAQHELGDSATGYGLPRLRRRVTATSSRFELISAKGRGTQASLHVPIATGSALSPVSWRDRLESVRDTHAPQEAQRTAAQ